MYSTLLGSTSVYTDLCTCPIQMQCTSKVNQQTAKKNKRQKDTHPIQGQRINQAPGKVFSPCKIRCFKSGREEKGNSIPLTEQMKGSHRTQMLSTDQNYGWLNWGSSLHPHKTSRSGSRNLQRLWLKSKLPSAETQNQMVSKSCQRVQMEENSWNANGIPKWPWTFN